MEILLENVHSIILVGVTFKNTTVGKNMHKYASISQNDHENMYKHLCQLERNPRSQSNEAT